MTTEDILEKADTTGLLCDLLLEFAGRSPGRMATAHRHILVLEAAFPHMDKAQKAEARRRIDHLETKWGPMLPGQQPAPEDDSFPPISRVAHWLSMRRVPARLLRIMYRAAVKVAEGETSLSVIMDYAFAKETDHLVIPVGYDSFKEWLLELRIAWRETKGIYRPGPLCSWWVSEMASSRLKGSPFQICLDQAWLIRHPKSRRDQT